MNYTEFAVDQTNRGLGHLYHALAGLHLEKAKHGRIGFQIMGEGIVGEILKLRKEIDDMIGLTDYLAEFGVPPTDEEIFAQAAASPVRTEMNGAAAPSAPVAT